MMASHEPMKLWSVVDLNLYLWFNYKILPGAASWCNKKWFSGHRIVKGYFFFAIFFLQKCRLCKIARLFGVMTIETTNSRWILEIEEKGVPTRRLVPNRHSTSNFSLLASRKNHAPFSTWLTHPLSPLFAELDTVEYGEFVSLGNGL